MSLKIIYNMQYGGGSPAACFPTAIVTSIAGGAD